MVMALPNSVPTISVVMPVYNARPYLADAIESILNQSFSDFEFIIIDDSSTDHSWDILNEYAQRDERIQLMRNEINSGITKSLNRGLATAQGKYIARQDGDDISYLERFTKQVFLLETNPDVVLVSCNLELINEQGDVIGYHYRSCTPELVAWYLLFYNHLAGHSQVMFRRELVADLGGYSGSRLHCEDYELWSRLVNYGKILIMPEILLKYRKHDQSVSSPNRAQQIESVLIQAGHNIELLSNQSLGLDELNDLRKFMMLPESSEHIDTVLSLNLLHLHNRLQVIYASFVASDRVSDRQGCQEIRRAIARKFIVLLNHIGWSGKVLTKLTLSWCVLRWSPRLMIENWKTTLSKKLSKKLRLT